MNNKTNPLVKSIIKKTFSDGLLYRVYLHPPYDDYSAILKENGQLDYVLNTRTGQNLAKRIAVKNLPQFIIDAFKSVESCVENLSRGD